MDEKEELMAEIANAIKEIVGSIENLYQDVVDFTAGGKRYSLQLEERK